MGVESVPLKNTFRQVPPVHFKLQECCITVSHQSIATLLRL